MDPTLELGRQVCGSLEEASAREWLLTDALGGYAMGTASGLRTRRYHGLLVAAGDRPGVRHFGLASLDLAVSIGDRKVRLSTHEWGSGAVDPAGHEHLASFSLRQGLPVWRFHLGEIVVETELGMARGRCAVAAVHRLLRAPDTVRLEVEALCTWRDIHGERFAGTDPKVEIDSGGFVFEDSFRVRGPGFTPLGVWYRDVEYRVEAERGLPDREDLWSAGTFSAELDPGELLEVVAWAGELSEEPPAASKIVELAAQRQRDVVRHALVQGEAEAVLVGAADQMIVSGPRVVAGYPWFGEWGRDTMISYEGLFLDTGRVEEGRLLLERTAGSVSEGMIANTTDGGDEQYNTADATLWFIHALHRHCARTGDLDLAVSLAPVLDSIVDHHVRGTRFGIRVDADGLLTQGEEGVALTWMDARIDGRPVTPRSGKAVEVNALWVNALGALSDLAARTRREPGAVMPIEQAARDAFLSRFPRAGGGLADVVDGPMGDDLATRPNQLFAVSLPFGPLRGRRGPFEACAPLLTSLGLRSLDPADPNYRARHRGGPAQRDAAYHQGTVWPWLIGPYVDAASSCGAETQGLLDNLVDHLHDFGLASVSETADGDPPHSATGCPFQAWSVAELLRSLTSTRSGEGTES